MGEEGSREATGATEVFRDHLKQVHSIISQNSLTTLPAIACFDFLKMISRSIVRFQSLRSYSSHLAIETNYFSLHSSTHRVLYHFFLLLVSLFGSLCSCVACKGGHGSKNKEMLVSQEVLKPKKPGIMRLRSLPA